MASLTKAQRLTLEWAADTGFARTSNRSEAMIEARVSMHTVAGLVRRGWVEESRNGIFRITPAGRAALSQQASDE